MHCNVYYIMVVNIEFLPLPRWKGLLFNIWNDIVETDPILSISSFRFD